MKCMESKAIRSRTSTRSISSSFGRRVVEEPSSLARPRQSYGLPAGDGLTPRAKPPG